MVTFFPQELAVTFDKTIVENNPKMVELLSMSSKTRAKEEGEKDWPTEGRVARRRCERRRGGAEARASTEEEEVGGVAAGLAGTAAVKRRWWVECLLEGSGNHGTARAWMRGRADGQIGTQTQ